jgi:hypothetical protein
MDNHTLDRLNSFLVGSTCRGMENLGDYVQFLFESTRLIVESAWRLAHEGQIMIGSASEDTVINKLPELVTGHRIFSINVYGEFHDLRIEFDNGMVFEVFAQSEQYEHWKVVGGPDKMIIAGPNKLWSSF